MSKSKKRRTYTKEFKLEAVRLWQTTDKSASDVEHDLGIGQGLIYKWSRKYKQNGDQAFPGRGELTPDQKRIRELERENEVLRQEREILKKAVAIFSNPKQ